MHAGKTMDGLRSLRKSSGPVFSHDDGGVRSFRGPRHPSQFHARANSRDLHLPRKKRQRSPQVPTLLCGNPGDGMIGGNVKPCALSVHQEQILFRTLVLPAHFPWTPEVCGTRFGAQNSPIFGVALQKGGLEGFRGAISCFHARGKLSGFSVSAERKQEANEDARQSGHRL